MARIGISEWQKRISPVFDTASRLWVVDIVAGERREAGYVLLPQAELWYRARVISEHGVDVLICGAISGRFHRMLNAAGIEVIAWRSGDVVRILDAYLRGELSMEEYFMPGCGLRRRCRKGRRGRGRQMKGV